MLTRSEVTSILFKLIFSPNKVGVEGIVLEEYTVDRNKVGNLTAGNLDELITVLYRKPKSHRYIITIGKL